MTGLFNYNKFSTLKTSKIGFELTFSRLSTLKLGQNTHFMPAISISCLYLRNYTLSTLWEVDFPQYPKITECVSYILFSTNDKFSGDFIGYFGSSGGKCKDG